MNKYFLQFLFALIFVGVLIGQPGRAIASTNDTATATPAAPQPTLAPSEGLITSTPNADGSIVHVVGNGEALWSIAIAYGVKIADILQNSNLPASTSVVYVGEKLTIRKGTLATQKPAITLTTPVVTRTRAPSRIPATHTPIPTETTVPTVTETVTPTQWLSALIPQGTRKQQIIGIGLVCICIIGLVVVGFTGFRKK